MFQLERYFRLALYTVSYSFYLSFFPFPVHLHVLLAKEYFLFFFFFFSFRWELTCAGANYCPVTIAICVMIYPAAPQWVVPYCSTTWRRNYSCLWCWAGSVLLRLLQLPAYTLSHWFWCSIGTDEALIGRHAGKIIRISSGAGGVESARAVSHNPNFGLLVLILLVWSSSDLDVAIRLQCQHSISST